MNTGEDEAAFMRRIRVTNYSEMRAFIDLMDHLIIL